MTLQPSRRQSLLSKVSAVKRVSPTELPAAAGLPGLPGLSSPPPLLPPGGGGGGGGKPPRTPRVRSSLAEEIERRHGSVDWHRAATERLETKAKQEAADAAATFKGRATVGLKEGLLKAIGDMPKTVLTAALAGTGAVAAPYLKDKLMKPSFGQRMFGAGGPVQHALGFGLGAGAIGAGAYGASKLWDVVSDPIAKKNQYDAMLKDNPHLKSEDAQHVRRSFETLRRFNPDMAADPHVAGSFVGRALAFKDEGVQATVVKTLTEIRKNMADAKSKRTGFLKGLLPGSAKELQSFEP